MHKGKCKFVNMSATKETLQQTKNRSREKRQGGCNEIKYKLNHHSMWDFKINNTILLTK